MTKPEHIVQTAQTLFSQFGLKKVTTDDIAREAKVSKATVYKHFSNKSEIFDKVIASEVDALLCALEEAVVQETDAVAKLRAHLKVRLNLVSELVNFYRVTQASWGDYWPHISDVRHDFLAKEQTLVARILREGVAAGELQVRDPEAAGLALVLGLASIEFQWTLEEGRLDLTELVDMMLDMMVEGLRKR